MLCHDPWTLYHPFCAAFNFIPSRRSWGSGDGWAPAPEVSLRPLRIDDAERKARADAARCHLVGCVDQHQSRLASQGAKALQHSISKWRAIMLIVINQYLMMYIISAKDNLSKPARPKCPGHKNPGGRHLRTRPSFLEKHGCA